MYECARARSRCLQCASGNNVVHQTSGRKLAPDLQCVITAWQGGPPHFTPHGSCPSCRKVGTSSVKEHLQLMEPVICICVHHHWRCLRTMRVSSTRQSTHAYNILDMFNRRSPHSFPPEQATVRNGRTFSQGRCGVPHARDKMTRRLARPTVNQHGFQPSSNPVKTVGDDKSRVNRPFVALFGCV